MGGKIKAKGRAERHPQPPRPPAGDRDGKVSRQRRGKPPALPEFYKADTPR